MRSLSSDFKFQGLSDGITKALTNSGEESSSMCKSHVNMPFQGASFARCGAYQPHYLSINAINIGAEGAAPLRRPHIAYQIPFSLEAFKANPLDDIGMVWQQTCVNIGEEPVSPG
jgi:hypothetical protein